MAIGDESLFRTDQSKLYVGIDNFGYSVPPGQAKDIVSQRSLPINARVRLAREEYEHRVGHHLASLQHDVGSLLVDELMRLGPSLVHMSFEMTADSRPPFYERMTLHAYVQPTGQQVEHIVYPIYVSHGVYFPKDWRCDKCGSLVDGLNHPRFCYQCNAPRSVTNV